MNRLNHIQQQKQILESRAHIIRWIREFFWTQHFLEVDPGHLVSLPGQEPHLSPVQLQIHNEKKETFDAYLHTSPEYAMKKMLGSGFENIFFLGKCYRDYESFGGHHNPEFTMLEWYRAHANMWDIMEDIEKLFAYVQRKLEKRNLKLESSNFHRLHMREVWQQHVGVNLDEYLTAEAMYALCIQRGYHPAADEPYEDFFYRIFLNEIEPKLIEPTIIHHYPAQMAALAKLSDTDPRYAERFEVYIGGIELANAFTELTDAEEQRRRLLEEQAQRQALGKQVFAIDEAFIDAVAHMPSSAGIAFGVDRFVQLLLGCQNIDDVLILPASMFTFDH